MLNYSGITYGYLTIKQGKERFKIDIRQANCLCAFIHVRKSTEEELKKYGPDAKYVHTLYSFFNDAQHIKNIMKDNDGKLFWDEVVKIELNTFYKESLTLLQHFTKAGYRVECYYEVIVPKTKK